MKDKVWITTEIATRFDQNIRIEPSESFDNITLNFKEFNDKEYGGSLYLDRVTLEAMIAKLRESLEYIEQP